MGDGIYQVTTRDLILRKTRGAIDINRQNAGMRHRFATSTRVISMVKGVAVAGFPWRMSE